MKTPKNTLPIDPKKVTGDPRNWTKEVYDAVKLSSLEAVAKFLGLKVTALAT